MIIYFKDIEHFYNARKFPKTQKSTPVIYLRERK